MPRRRRSFFFDNIHKKLKINTLETTKTSRATTSAGLKLEGYLDANGNKIDMGTNDITDAKVGQWNTAYGWGDHASAGYSTYSNSDVDAHLNQSNPTSGYVLSWNGSDYAWVEQSGGVTSYNDLTDKPTIPTNNNQLTNGAGYSTFSGSYNDLTNKPTIPTNNNQLTNGAGYITASTTVNEAYAVDIEDTRSAQRPPSDMPSKQVSAEFTNQIVSDWHSLINVKGWSDGYASWQLIGPSSTTSHNNLYFRSGVGTSTSNWSGPFKIWHAGNDGSGSGLDADTLDGTQLSAIKTNSSTDTNSIWIRNTSPTIYFRDTDHRGAMLHNNSNLFYVLRGSQATDSTSWATVNGRWPLTINLNNNDATFGGNVTAYSDARLKENVEPIGITIEQFKSLEAKRFDWKADGKHDVGFIAQDVEAAGLVEVVKEHENRDPGTGELLDTYKTLDYARMVPFLWDIVQKQQKQIEELQAKIS